VTLIHPHEQAWLDQQDAQLRDAINLVLNGIRPLAGQPENTQREIATHIGHALQHHLDQLDEEETRVLARTAIVRLAQHIDQTGAS
jgi:hypothetical protein